jgi:hypothetical protein
MNAGARELFASSLFRQNSLESLKRPNNQQTTYADITAYHFPFRAKGNQSRGSYTSLLPGEPEFPYKHCSCTVLAET